MLDRAGKTPTCLQDLWNFTMHDLNFKMVDGAQDPTPRPCGDRSLQRLAICYSLLPPPAPRRFVSTGGSDLGSGASDKPKATRP